MPVASSFHLCDQSSPANSNHFALSVCTFFWYLLPNPPQSLHQERIPSRHPQSTMAVAAQILELKAVVTSQCQILTDSASPQFQEYAKRWTDIDRQIPAAIVLPTTEEDIQKTVNIVWLPGESALTCETGPMGRAAVDPICDPERRP